LSLDFQGAIARIVDQRLMEVIWHHVEVLVWVCGDKTSEASGEVLHALFRNYYDSI
jgi:hypothetical protein